MKGGSNSGDPPAETVCRSIGCGVVQEDSGEGRQGGGESGRSTGEGDEMDRTGVTRGKGGKVPLASGGSTASSHLQASKNIRWKVGSQGHWRH